jgi:alpha-glucosidase
VFGGDAREVYLPKGAWRDWWTGDVYEGEKSFAYHAPLERLPLFVKAGSIVPMQQAMSFTGEKHVDTLSLHVFPGAKPTAVTVYDDDGETLNYARGQHVTVECRCEPKPGSLELTVGAPNGAYPAPWKQVEWKVGGIEREPAAVQVEGRNAARSQPKGTADGALGYSYDAASHTLTIRAPFGRRQTARIVLN